MYNIKVLLKLPCGVFLVNRVSVYIQRLSPPVLSNVLNAIPAWRSKMLKPSSLTSVHLLLLPCLCCEIDVFVGAYRHRYISGIL